MGFLNSHGSGAILMMELELSDSLMKVWEPLKKNNSDREISNGVSFSFQSLIELSRKFQDFTDPD